VQKAYSFIDKVYGNYQLPQWYSSVKNRQQYRPSHNVAPTDGTPVLVSGSHFNGESDRMLQPVTWGMIPIWHEIRISGEAVNNLEQLII
jgi:putative SOS response-associated peptidase YedK